MLSVFKVKVLEAKHVLYDYSFSSLVVFSHALIFNEDLSLLLKISSPKPLSAPFIFYLAASKPSKVQNREHRCNLLTKLSQDNITITMLSFHVMS